MRTDTDGDPPSCAKLGGTEPIGSERSGRGGLWDPLPIEGSTVGSGARSSFVLASLGGAASVLGGAPSVSVESLAELRSYCAQGYATIRGNPNLRRDSADPYTDSHYS